METQIKKQTNLVIDYAKSVLIILVVIGHIIPLSLSESFTRTVIYSFHMPLFLGISGMIIKTDNFKNHNIQQFILKYTYRLLVPWIIAFLIYYLFINYEMIINGQLNFINTIFNILYPYYHLWYGLSFFLMLLFTFIFFKTHQNLNALFVITIILSLIIHLNSKSIRTPHEENGLIMNLLGDKRTFIYYPYFIWGMMLQNSTKITNYFTKKSSQCTFSLIIAFTLIILIYCFIHQTTLPFGLSIIFNLSIIAKVKKLSTMETFSGLRINSIISWLSSSTLFIYLYHPIIIQITKITFQKYIDSITIYVIVTLLITGTLIVIEKILKKQKKLHLILCGN